MTVSYLEKALNLPWEWKRYLSGSVATQDLWRITFNAIRIVGKIDPDVADYATTHLAQELSDVPPGRVNFTKCTSRHAWLSHHAAVSNLPRPFLDFVTSPASAVRNAYTLACLATTRSEPYEAVSAFGLIGCIVDSIASQNQCCLCPRLAPPGRDHCEDHAQPKAHSATQPNKVARAAAIARRVKDRYGGNWMHLRAPSFEDVMFGVLWPRYTPGLVVETWSAAVDHVLSNSANVSLRLPGGFHEFTFEDKLDALRLTLDPNGLSVSDWPVKIAVFDTWLEMESEATPRRRTMTLENQLMCQRAIRFLASGMAQVDVAQRLGRNGSYLGRLIKTYRRMQSDGECHPLATSEAAVRRRSS